MGQPTSPVAKALNARLIELVREAIGDAEITTVARASLIPRTTLQNIIGPDGRMVTTEQATRIALALGVDPGVWFANLRELALDLGVRPIAEGVTPIPPKRPARSTRTTQPDPQ